MTTTWLVLAVLARCAAGLESVGSLLNMRQPRLRVENGHLYVEGPRNISISASQGLMIQGMDMGKVVTMIRRLEPVLSGAAARPGSTEGPLAFAERNALRRRVDRLENLVNGLVNVSSTTIAGRPGPTQMLTIGRRLRLVERKVNTIQRLLTTNECASNPCLHGGSCEDVYNGFICRCTPGWEGAVCEADVDECLRLGGTGLGCQSGGSCVNSPGSYHCICPPGFYGVHCAQQTASCSSGNDLCGAYGLCVPAAANGYTCICNPGWQQDPATAACTKDVDECAASRPPCSHDPAVPCVNVPGSFHCGSCPQGYVGNGYYCTDVDECLVNNGGCSTSPSVQCINTRGSSVCGPCPPGYRGDGRTCAFQGVCQVDNGGCHPLAVCINVPGSGMAVSCQCRPGYTGMGVGPQGCVPLPSAAAATGPCASTPCRNGATCTNSAGSYTCTCTPVFKGRNCETPDPCGSSPCANGAACAPQGDSYACDCPDGFTGERCETKHEACGGFLRSEAGTLRFPHNNNSNEYPHGANCGWVIVTNSTRVLNVTFRHFDVEASAHCSYDWLQIHDGPTSGAFQLGRFCGSLLPKGGNLVSTHNTLYLWFRSDSSITRQGFELHWTSVPPVCGGQVNFETHASVSSPGSPGKYPADRDCWWHLAAPPGRRVQLHFFSMQIEEHENCSYDYLEVIDGPRLDGPRLARYCNSSEHPAPLVSSGNELQLHFHSDHEGQDAGFQIAAAAAEGTPGCGGVFTEPSGTVRPPMGPEDDYRPNMDCGWKIQVPLSERVTLDFEGDFAIESGTNCVFDFVEIYDGPDRSAPLVGRYCGTDRPSHTLSSGNALFVYFHSDMSYELKGFELKYQVFCGGVFTALQGEFSSPYYPSAYPQSRRCVYEIRLPPKTAVALQFLDFDVEHNSVGGECYYDYVKVRDGDSANSSLIGTYCGEKAELPDRPLVSTHNFMFVEFSTDATISERGFRANYSAIDLPCGGILKERHGLLEPPRAADGESYPSEARCSWLLVAPPGFVVQLTFVAMTMERCRDCGCDYVAVFDNATTPGTGGLLGRFCGRTLPPVMTSTDSVMNVVFKSDNTVHMEGFTATYTFLDASRLCGARFLAPSGVLRSPNYPAAYPNSKDCTYLLRVQNNQQIRLNFSDFDLEYQQGCNWDFVEIRNGGSERSPLVGRFCGNTAPPPFISASNEVYVRLKTDASRGGRGFVLTWDSASTGCGGVLNASSGTIHSPNYPDASATLAHCLWSVAVARGSVIKASFSDLDVYNSPTCSYDFVELYDGPPGKSNRLGRYCSGRPDPIVTTANHLYVRLRVSSMSGRGRGFALDYESSCNANLTGRHGVIESPNWPWAAPRRANCTWVVTVPLGSTVNITFSHLSLVLPLSLPRSFRQGGQWIGRPGVPFRTPALRQQETDEMASCSYLFVKIQDSVRREDDRTLQPGPELGRFCGTKLPPMVASKSNKVYVTFANPTMGASNGFRMEWVAEGCGGELRRPEGGFTSPNYPRAYKDNAVCEWLITVDWGQSVELTIWDMNLERVQSCGFDHLAVYGGPDDTSPELSTLCHSSNKSIVLTSSSRQMFVRFRSDMSYAGRGFNATYRARDGECGGRLTAPYGALHSKNYPENYGAADDCVWRIEVAPQHAVQLAVKDMDIDFSRNCTSDYLEVVDGPDLNGTVLLHACGSSLAKNTTLVSTTNVMTVRMKSDGTRYAKGFKAEYKTVCGSRIVTAGSGLISTHEAINVQGDNPNCTWTLVAQDPGSHVTLTVTQLVVTQNTEGEEGCTDGNHLDVYEGEDADGVLLGRYCSGRLPRPIVSRGSALHLSLVSPYNDFHGWFSAAYSVLNTGCGGTFRAERGSIATPGYPDSYPPNSECVWNITSAPGSKVQLSFPAFGLEESPGCVDDFVEIRREHALGALLGAFCGDEAPANLTAEHALWIKFRSNGQGTAPGFVADFALVHGNLDLTGASGQIGSPLYPAIFGGEGDFYWRVTVAVNKVIAITFKDFSTDRFVDDCEMVYLEIHDGFDETTPSLFKDCGVLVPDAVTTTSNVAYVHLHNNPLRRATSILLDWVAVERAAKEVVAEPLPGCGARIHIPAGNITVVTSPGFPDGYGPALNCSWQLDTVPGWHLHLHIHVLDLELQHDCASDKVLVYSGRGGGPDWKLSYTLCFPNASYNGFLTTTNFMLINFVTDWGINGTGFNATVNSVCGGELSGPSGTIISPPIPTERGLEWVAMACEWVVTARRGRTLAASITAMAVRSEAGDGEGPGTCGNAYVLLKNGGSAASPLLGEGKYCGEAPRTDIPETSGNQLYVKLDRHDSQLNFTLRYEERSSACSREVRLADAPGASWEAISSPRYPNIPPPYAECVWTVLAPPGRSVRIDFLGRFDVTSTGASCRDSAVEVRDGATEVAALLGNFCNSKPSSVDSTSNVMRIKYFNEEDVPGDGFSANVSIATCGGTLRAEKGVLTSPGYPNAYPPNVRCEWRLVVRSTATMTLTFTDLGMAGVSIMPGLRRTAICKSDFVSVVSKALEWDASGNGTGNATASGSGNSTDLELGRFCGMRVPDNITSLGNEMQVVFQSSMAPLANYRGFALRFVTNSDDCGGTLEAASGTIRSPGYPFRVPRRRCMWTIRAPEGRRVTATFADIDLSTTTFHGYALQRVSLYESEEGAVLSNVVNFTVPSGTVLESSSNVMVVVYSPKTASTNRGFRIEYTTDKPALCGGRLPASMVAPLVQPASSLTTYRCSWRFEAPVDSARKANRSTLAVKVAVLEGAGHYRNPCNVYTQRVVLRRTDKTVLAQLCYSINSPVTFLSPYIDNVLEAWQSWYMSTMNFSIEHTWSACGGVLDSPEEITSPGFYGAGTYPNHTYCAWKISFEEGTQVLLTFDTLDLPSSCADFVEVHNGEDARAPGLGPFCRRGVEPLHSSGRHLWIEFHSANTAGPRGRGFKITFSSTARACGGLMHGKSGEFSSPGFPSAYASNVECQWEVRVANGYRVRMRFVERFHLQARDNCTGDHLELADWDEASREWTPPDRRLRLCGRTPPADDDAGLTSSGSRMRFTFRSDGSGSAEGFKARWSTVCGFRRTLTTANARGEVVSPGFPVAYPAFVNCSYDLLAPGLVIVARFANFSVEQGLGSSCHFDNVTLVATKESEAVAFTPGAVYCNEHYPPPEIRVKNRLLFTFKTDHWIQMQGFRLVYSLDLCDRAITEEGEIASPMNGNEYSSLANCTWNITAPPGHVIRLRLKTFEAEMSYECFSDVLAVFDGPSATNESALLGRFCGNLSHSLPVLRSTGRAMVVRWTTDGSVQAAGFTAMVIFDAAHCGSMRSPFAVYNATSTRSTIDLSTGSVTMSQDSLQPFQDCEWMLDAGPGENVHLRVNEIATVAACPNSTRHRDVCDCDYVEVFDGLSPNSDRIGRFCSARPVPPIASSDRYLMVRLSTASWGSSGRFMFSAFRAPSPCGNTSFTLNENTTQITIQSPNYPLAPPASRHCVYVVDTGAFGAVLNVTALELDGPARCAKGGGAAVPADFINTGRLDITKGTGSTWSTNEKVIVGKQLRTMHPRMFESLDWSDQTMSFCGRERPPLMDISPYSGTTKIDYHSGSEPAGRGFQIRITSAQGCPPSELTDTSGTLQFTSGMAVNEPLSCVVRIRAQANRTVTLYVAEHSYINPSEQCADGALELLDGAETSSPLLARLCGADIARGVSSSGSTLTAKYWKGNGASWARVTAYYHTTDQGRGCGGSVHQDAGVLFSPLYPAPYRNTSVCRWDIEVPGARNPVLNFKAFDLGPNTSCDSDFVEVWDVFEEGREEKRARYCGQERPAAVRGNAHRMALTYSTTVRNGGIGWLAEFKSMGSGEALQT